MVNEDKDLNIFVDVFAKQINSLFERGLLLSESSNFTTNFNMDTDDKPYEPQEKTLEEILSQNKNIYKVYKEGGDYKKLLAEKEEEEKKLQEEKEKDNLATSIPLSDEGPQDNNVFAEDVYQYIINASKKYLYITTPYLVIDNQLMSDLIFAAQRGVKVRIAVPAKPDHLLTFCVGKTFQKNLMDYGIEVYEYQKGFIHAKTFISDGKMATVGSVNLDYRSLYHHFECGCFMYDVPAIKEIEKDFESIVKDSSLMTKETYKRIPAIRRALGRVFRIFSPLI